MNKVFIEMARKWLILFFICIVVQVSCATIPSQQTQEGRYGIQFKSTKSCDEILDKYTIGIISIFSKEKKNIIQNGLIIGTDVAFLARTGAGTKNKDIITHVNNIALDGTLENNMKTLSTFISNDYAKDVEFKISRDNSEKIISLKSSKWRDLGAICNDIGLFYPN
jgi:hypothetical protein